MWVNHSYVIYYFIKIGNIKVRGPVKVIQLPKLDNFSEFGPVTGGPLTPLKLPEKLIVFCNQCVEISSNGV